MLITERRTFEGERVLSIGISIEPATFSKSYIQNFIIFNNYVFLKFLYLLTAESFFFRYNGDLSNTNSCPDLLSYILGQLNEIFVS